MEKFHESILERRNKTSKITDAEEKQPHEVHRKVI